ncbi:unnamed protein product [Microthlaspi erraticum]|uniref:Uncharacterized protein n=1 Tax=Microthlaspi erraticum TaxID=1685480 RepID=A0A6D2HE33_9BRAS|nr:unnamed protein product [Microthlaspi erraticum]
MDDVEKELDPLPSEGFMKLTQDETRVLCAPFTEEEFVKAVRSMNRFKAPGPDGYQPVFNQKYWEEVGESLKRENEDGDDKVDWTSAVEFHTKVT